jgi:hypothetical protein
MNLGGQEAPPVLSRDYDKPWSHRIGLGLDIESEIDFLSHPLGSWDIRWVVLGDKTVDHLLVSKWDLTLSGLSVLFAKAIAESQCQAIYILVAFIFHCWSVASLQGRDPFWWSRFDCFHFVKHKCWNFVTHSLLLIQNFRTELICFLIG